MKYLFLFILLGFYLQAVSQISYYNHEPNVFLCPGKTIDLDKDGIDDINGSCCYYPYGEWYSYFSSSNTDIQMCGTVLSYGQIIDSTQNYVSSYSLFFNPSSAFFGFRKRVNNEWHYGWFRVIKGSWGCLFTDCALCITPGIAVFSGEGMVNCASEIQLKDVNDVNNASDLQYSFISPYFSNEIDSLKLYILNETSAPDILSIDFDTVVHYVGIASSGTSTYSGFLPASASDINGNTIHNGNAYCLVVESVAPDTNFSGISSASPFVLMESIFDDVGIISVKDSGNTNTASDLYVRFNPLTNSMNLGEYRLFVYTSANELIPIDDLQNNQDYVSFPLDYDGGWVQLPGNLKTVSGSDILPNIKYQCLILCVPESGSEWTASFSRTCNSFILSDPPCFFAGQTYNVVNGSLNHADIRYMSIDIDNDGVVDLTFYYDGQGMSPSNCSGGENLRVSGQNGTTLKAGKYMVDFMYEPIYDSAIYKTALDVWIHSYGVPPCNYLDNYSFWIQYQTGYISYRIPIDSVNYKYGWLKLEYPYYGLEFAVQLDFSSGISNLPENVSLSSNGNYSNSSDLLYSFQSAPYQDFVDHYRIYLLHSDLYDNYELIDLDTATQYLRVDNSGLISYNGNFPEDFNDINHHAVTLQNSYFILVRAVGSDSLFSSVVSASSIVLFDAINELQEQEVSLFPNPAHSEICIIGEARNEYNRVEIHSLQGVKLIEEDIHDSSSNCISVTKLRSGTYYYRLQNNNGTIKVGKLILMN